MKCFIENQRILADSELLLCRYSIENLHSSCVKKSKTPDFYKDFILLSSYIRHSYFRTAITSVGTNLDEMHLDSEQIINPAPLAPDQEKVS